MPLGPLVRFVGLASRACGTLAAFLMMAACVVVCQLVFVRYVLNGSTIWQTEFVLFSVVAATLIGSPYVLATRGHVGVDFVASHAGPGLRRALGVLASLAGIAFCAVLAWSGWRYFHEALVNGWVTESVWAPPLWIVLLPLPLGVGLLTLQYCVDLVCLVAGYEPPATAGGDA